MKSKVRCVSRCKNESEDVSRSVVVLVQCAKSLQFKCTRELSYHRKITFSLDESLIELTEIR